MQPGSWTAGSIAVDALAPRRVGDLAFPITQAYVEDVVLHADIEQMAGETKRGYYVQTLKSGRRGRPMLGSAPSEVVPVHLNPDLRQAVEAHAAAKQTTTSEFIRAAMHRFLDVA